MPGPFSAIWLRPLLYLWASPATCIGLSLVPLAYLTGGQARIVSGVVEVHGGIVTVLLRRGLPFFGGGAAITLGHVILGRNQYCLDQSRSHEHVHVRQFERWGPIFLPVYMMASFIAYCRGRDPYLDNPFEQEAFAVDVECDKDRENPGGKCQAPK